MRIMLCKIYLSRYTSILYLRLHLLQEHSADKDFKMLQSSLCIRWISRDPSHSGFASFSCSPSSLEVPQKFSCVSSCCCTYGHPQTLVITHEQHDETAYNGWYYHRALQFTINDNSYCMLANNGLLFMNTQFT